MGYGGPIGLIVVGLVLSLALNDRQVGPLDVWVLGLILAGAGVLWLILTIVQQNSRNRSTTVATTTDAHGRRATTEQHHQSDPPAPPAV
jgi:uncharacterized membrane protein YecN with MAPEG domain